MIMKELVLSALTALLPFGVSEAAVLTAEQALARLDGAAVPAAAKMKARSKTPLRLIASSKTEAGNAAYYVFSDDARTLVMSADDMVTPLLAYFDRPVLSLDSIAPSTRAWLDEYAAQIEWAQANPSLVSAPAKVPNHGSISPLCATQWDQNWPYNMYTPSNYPTGCVATSMAQVMYYYKYPSKGTGSISYTQNGTSMWMDFGSTYFDWNNMLTSYSGAYNDTQSSAVATLMKACGYAVQMEYAADGSGAHAGRVRSALVDYFGYDKGTKYVRRKHHDADEWDWMIYDNLKDVGPVIYSGYGNGGHCFVVDGYASNGYYHLNWGWAGVADGFYLLSALNPTNLGTGAGYGKYNNDQDAVLDLRTPQQWTTASRGWLEIWGLFDIEPSGRNIKMVSSASKGTGGFWNESGITDCLHAGAIITNGTKSYYLDGASADALKLHYGWTYYTVYVPTSVPDGDYTLTAAYSLGDGKWYPDYYDRTVGERNSIYITIRNGSVTKRSGTVPDPGSYLGDFSEGWNLSTKRGTNTSKGYDAANIRNCCYKDGKLYCVYEHRQILVIDAQSGNKLRELDVTGVSGGTLALCDVTVCDGRILACNLAQSSKGDKLRIYQWDSDTGSPRCILETNDFQNATRLGDCMEVVGTPGSDAWYAFAQDDGSVTRVVEYHQTGSSWTPKYTKVYNAAGNGRLVTGATTRAYPKSGNYWIDGNNSNPTWVTWYGGRDGVSYTTSVNVSGTQQGGGNHHEFYFKGLKYAANMVFRGSANFTGAKLRILHDPAGNFSNITHIQEMPWDGLGDAKNSNGTGNVCINTDSETFVEAWVLSTTQGMAYYRYGDVPASARPTLSFNVKDAEVRACVGESQTLTFTLSGENLRGGIDITPGGQHGAEDVDKYVITPTHLDAPGQVTVKYTPTGNDYNWIWLGAASDGAESVWVDIHGRGYKRPSVEVTGGDENFKTSVGEPVTHHFTVLAHDMKGIPYCGVWGDNTEHFSMYNDWGMTSSTTVYFDNSRPNWDNVYVWIWDTTNTSRNYTGGVWPGTKLTPDASGRCSFTFTPDNFTNDLGILFHNNNGTWTDDGYLVNDAVYSAAATVADRVKNGIDGNLVKMPLLAELNSAMHITYNPSQPGWHPSNYYIAMSGMSPNYDVAIYGSGSSSAESLEADAFMVSVSGGVLTVRGCEAKTIRLHSVTGALVAMADATNTMNVSGMAPGTYLCTVTTASGDTRRVKLKL